MFELAKERINYWSKGSFNWFRFIKVFKHHNFSPNQKDELRMLHAEGEGAEKPHETGDA